MKTIDRCPACDTGSPEQRVSLDAERSERFVAFDQRKFDGLLTSWLGEVQVAVSQCKACGHAWYRTQPSPGQLQQMYAGAKPLFAGADGISRQPTPAMQQEMTRLRRVLPVAKARPALLDYGSGFGRWARAAAQAGFVVTGFEPSHARGAEEQTTFELVNSLEQLRGRRFDVLQLEQVLEHVTDPLGTLRSLHEYCHADTVLRITVPNILRAPEGDRLWESWPFDGKVPHTLAPFEHLHGFTPRSLRVLCERAGFRIDSGLRVWRYYPVNQLRRLCGELISTLDSTQLILRSPRVAGARLSSRETPDSSPNH